MIYGFIGEMLKQILRGNFIPPFNFCGIDERYSSFENSKVVILPVPFERTSSYRSGTKDGPKALVDASRNMEMYDQELDFEPYEVGIHTLDHLVPEYADTEDVINEIREVVLQLLHHDKFVITLGGEHTISIGAVAAYAESFSDLSILQLDAHADIREKYEGDKHSHACVMRSIYGTCSSIVQVGIRSLCKEEADFIKDRKIPVYFAHQINDSKEWYEQAVSALSKDVYLTIDLDVFDPSVVPGVGTPEPGGMSWQQVVSFLKYVSERRNLVGFDVMELMPLPGSVISEFTAAKLVYKILGYSIIKSRG